MKNVLSKLNQIRARIRVDKEQGNRYKSFTIATLNANLNPLLVELNIGTHFNYSSDGEHVLSEISSKTSTDKYGAEVTKSLMAAQGTIEYIITDLDSGEFITVRAPFVGFNEEGDPSKSCGNAFSYSYKYAWITLLGLTDETLDVDAPVNQKEKTEEEEPEAPVNSKSTDGLSFTDFARLAKLSQTMVELDSFYQAFLAKATTVGQKSAGEGIYNQQKVRIMTPTVKG